MDRNFFVKFLENLKIDEFLKQKVLNFEDCVNKYGSKIEYNEYLEYLGLYVN